MGRSLIKATDSEPDIWLYDKASDLQAHWGYPAVNGFFDLATNTIHATRDSLAHEIAHFKDIQSGRFVDWQKTSLSLCDQTSAQIRNEVVAIVYAWRKNAEPEKFSKFEKELLELIYHILDTEHFPYDNRDLASLKFSEIQDLADWISKPERGFRPKLEQIFGHYIQIGKTSQAYGKILSIIRG